MVMSMSMERLSEGILPSYLQITIRIRLSKKTCSHWLMLSMMATIVPSLCMDRPEAARLTPSSVHQSFSIADMINGECALESLIIC
jgi:hypothetical protein